MTFWPALCPECRGERRQVVWGRVERCGWCDGSGFDPGGRDGAVRRQDIRQTIAASDLTAPERFVWTVLALHTGPDDTARFMSLARLVDETGLSRSTVIRALKVLGSKRYVEQRKTQGPVPVYVLLKTCPTCGQSRGCHCDTGVSVTRTSAMDAQNRCHSDTYGVYGDTGGNGTADAVSVPVDVDKIREQRQRIIPPGRLAARQAGRR